jgi:hypothetical protein
MGEASLLGWSVLKRRAPFVREYRDGLATTALLRFATLIAAIGFGASQ